MKDSIKTKSFVYVYLVILSFLSILISCSCKENFNHKLNTGQTSAFLELYKIKEKIELDIINGLNNINQCSKNKKSLEKQKAELDKYKKGMEALDKETKALGHGSKDIENKLEKVEKDIKSVDIQLKELEAKQKQNHENLSVSINKFNEKSIAKTFRQYIVDLIALIKEYKKVEETTEDKNKLQKNIEDLEKALLHK